MLDLRHFIYSLLLCVLATCLSPVEARDRVSTPAMLYPGKQPKPEVVFVPDESLTPERLKARYPTGSITTVKQADRALAEVQKGRKQIEARMKADETACYKTFMANRCVTDAKARRRAALAGIKPIQIEADRFKRREAVAKRDKALEDKRVTDANRPRSSVDTHAEHFSAKAQERQRKADADAAQREANKVAFEKKDRDREKAQRRVLEKRKKTEKRRRKKAASAAAAAKKIGASGGASSAAASAK